MMKDLTWISTAGRTNNNQRIHTLAYLQMCFWVLLIYFHDLKFPFFLMDLHYDIQNWKHIVQSVPQRGLACRRHRHYSPHCLYRVLYRSHITENGMVHLAWTPSRRQGVTRAVQGSHPVIWLPLLCPLQWTGSSASLICKGTSLAAAWDTSTFASKKSSQW